MSFRDSTKQGSHIMRFYDDAAALVEATPSEKPPISEHVRFVLEFKVIDIVLGRSSSQRSRELQPGVVAQFHSFTTIGDHGGNCDGTVIWSDGPPIDWTSKVVISPVRTIKCDAQAMVKFGFHRPENGIWLHDFCQIVAFLNPRAHFIAISNESDTGDSEVVGALGGEGWNVMKCDKWLAQTMDSSCWLDWAAFHLFAEEPGSLEPQDCEDWRLWNNRAFRQNENALMEIYACDSSWTQVVLSANVEASFPANWKLIEHDEYTS